MNTNSDSHQTEAEAARATYCPVDYATVFKERWERAVNASKTSLDLAVESNAEALASYQKALNVPNPFLFALAGRALEGYVTFQKGLLDLAVKQSTAGIAAAEQPSHDPGEAKDGNVRQSRARAHARTSGIDRAAKQTKTLCDTGKPQLGLSSTPVQSGAALNSVQLRFLAKEIVDIAISPPAKSTVQ